MCMTNRMIVDSILPMADPAHDDADIASKTVLLDYLSETNRAGFIFPEVRSECFWQERAKRV